MNQPIRKVATDPVSARARFLFEVLAPKRPMQIVDVGANPTGSTPEYKTLLDIDAARLWGFEPNEDAYERLKAMKDTRRTFLPVAVGTPGPAVFHSHQLSTMSSMLKIRQAAAEFLGKMHWVRREVTPIDVDLVALDDVDEVPPIDLLKLDVQGAELDVIQSGRDKLKDAVVVIPEVAFYQIYEDQPMLRDIDAELHRLGFVMHKILFQKAARLPSSQRKKLHKRRGASQSIDGDAVYIRDLENADSLDAEAIKYLAMAADSVFESYDLCLMCLDKLARRGEIEAETAARYVELLPEDVLA